MVTIASAPPPASGGTDTRNAVARGIGIGLAAIAVVVGAWFGFNAWRDSSSATAPVAVPSAAARADAPSPVIDPHDRARAQIAADRIAQPAGDNAAETYLGILADNPSDSSARQALVEILPLVNDVANSAAEAGQVEELARLIALIQQADASYAQLPRLQQRHADLVTATEQLAAAAAQREALARQQDDAPPGAGAAGSDPALAASAQSTVAPAEPVAPTPARTVAAASPPDPTPPTGAADGRLATAAPPPVVASSAASAAAPLARRDTVVDPVLLRRVEPRYPPQALARRLEGFVEVELTISPSGQTTDVRVVRAEPNTPLFTREALRVARDWRYQPKTIDGVPAQSTVRQRLNFRLPRG